VWVDSFVGETAKHFDTPDEFLQAVGYFTAGAALANRVYLRSPRFLGSNLYVILTSPPGWSHKSSAVLSGVDVLRQLVPKDEVLPTNPSVEALGRKVPTLCKQDVGHGVMLYDEFRSFLAHVKKEYASQMASLVVERFERGLPTTFSKVKDSGTEEYVISGKFILSFIASTQTPWLIENMKGSDISGGLMSRFLLVESREQKRIYALPPPMDDKAMAVLTSNLETIRDAHVSTEYTFHSKAAKRYEALYMDLKKDAESNGHPEYASLISRSPVYLKKIALLHAVLEGRCSTLIFEADVEAAWGVVKKSVESCRHVIDEAAAQEGIYGRSLIRARKIISAAEKIARHEILKLLHVKPKELDEILESLEQQGVVELVKEGGRISVVWKGLQ